jgi:dTMP kinase
MSRANSRRLKRGVLIAVEGIDGTGKSTQVARLVARLAAKGWPVVETREPTDGEWGRRIRRLAKEGRDGVRPEDELDWFLKDRMEDADRTIRPGLREGKIVVTDRYYFSNMAYQGALGIDPVRIQEMNEALFPRPDLVILLRAAPALGIERIVRDRPRGTDPAYEQEAFLRRVADLFEGFRDPAIRRIDAAGTPDEVQVRVWEAVDRFLADLPGEGLQR